MAFCNISMKNLRIKLRIKKNLKCYQLSENPPRLQRDSPFFPNKFFALLYFTKGGRRFLPVAMRRGDEKGDKNEGETF